MEAMPAVESQSPISGKKSLKKPSVGPDSPPKGAVTHGRLDATRHERPSSLRKKPEGNKPVRPSMAAPAEGEDEATLLAPAQGLFAQRVVSPLAKPIKPKDALGIRKPSAPPSKPVSRPDLKHVGGLGLGLKGKPASEAKDALGSRKIGQPVTKPGQPAEQKHTEDLRLKAKAAAKAKEAAPAVKDLTPKGRDKGGPPSFKKGLDGAPPPLPSFDEELELACWYVATPGMQRGPVSELEVGEMIIREDVRSDGYVWREGMAQWSPILEVEEFATIVRSTKQGMPAVPPPSPFCKGEGLSAAATNSPAHRGDYPGLFRDSSSALAFRDSDSADQSGRLLSDSFDSLRDSQELPSSTEFSVIVRLKRQSNRFKLALAFGLPVIALVIAAIFSYTSTDWFAREEIATNPPTVPDSRPKARRYSEEEHRKLFGLKDVPQAEDGDGSQQSDDLGDKAKLSSKSKGSKLAATTGEAKSGKGAAPVASAAQAGASRRSLPREVAPDDDEGDGKSAEEMAKVSSAPTRSLTRNDEPQPQSRLAMTGARDLEGYKREAMVDRQGLIPERAVDRNLPSTLQQDQITKVIRERRRFITSCLERHLKREGTIPAQKATISFVIKPSGNAVNAMISEGLQETFFGRCIQQQIRTWRFPQFNGQDIPVHYPVVLTTTY